MTVSTRISSSLLLLALATSACGGARHLVASDGSHRLVARDDQHGVTIVLTTEAWDDATAISDDMTVMHVLVANTGAQPIRLAPGDFELRNERGFLYPLLDAGSTFATADSGDAGQRRYEAGQARDVRNIVGLDNELSRSALPWGTLLPGTEMRGFVYFDAAATTSNALTLRWHAHTPGGDKQLTEFAFPLHIAVVQ